MHQTFIVVLPSAYGIADTLKKATSNALKAMPRYLKDQVVGQSVKATIAATDAPLGEVSIRAGFGVEVTVPNGYTLDEWVEQVKVPKPRN